MTIEAERPRSAVVRGGDGGDAEVKGVGDCDAKRWPGKT